MRGLETPRQWLAGETGGTPHRAAALEELLLLWTANRNEAFQPFEELFEDRTLAEKTVYRQVTQQLPEYFATRPLIPLADAKPMNLLDLLRAPAHGFAALAERPACTDSRALEAADRRQPGAFLLIAGEILREEELAIWMQFNPPAQAPRRPQRRRESGQQQWPAW